MAKNYCATRLYGNSQNGLKWDDGTFSGIKRIVVTTDADAVTSLTVMYALEGRDPSVRHQDFGGLKHGGTGDNKKEFLLDFPREYLVKIRGNVGQAGGITSLSFETNRRKLEPCGREVGTPFETDADGVIVGLFGTATTTSLSSLAAYMLLD